MLPLNTSWYLWFWSFSEFVLSLLSSSFILFLSFSSWTLHWPAPCDFKAPLAAACFENQRFSFWPLRLFTALFYFCFLLLSRFPEALLFSPTSRLVVFRLFFSWMFDFFVISGWVLTQVEPFFFWTTHSLIWSTKPSTFKRTLKYFYLKRTKAKRDQLYDEFVPFCVNLK